MPIPDSSPWTSVTEATRESRYAYPHGAGVAVALVVNGSRAAVAARAAAIAAFQRGGIDLVDVVFAGLSNSMSADQIRRLLETRLEKFGDDQRYHSQRPPAPPIPVVGPSPISIPQNIPLPQGNSGSQPRQRQLPLRLPPLPSSPPPTNAQPTPRKMP